MYRGRKDSSSSSSSDDDQQQKKTPVYIHNNRCTCEVIRQESYAVLSNIMLEATVRLGVEERIALDVPMHTECTVRQSGYQPVYVDTPVQQKTVTVQPAKPVVVPKPQPAKVEQAKPVSRTASVVKEVFKIVVEVNDLPKMDTFLNGGSADPYFYFYLDSKLYFGGRDKAIKNSRKGQWSFPILASLVRGASKITIKWFDFDQVGKDDEIGTTELEVSKAIRHITAGTSNKSVTNFLTISGKKADKASVSVTIIKE